LIIDEEQKFGVRHKEHFKKLFNEAKEEKEVKKNNKKIIPKIQKKAPKKEEDEEALFDVDDDES